MVCRVSNIDAWLPLVSFGDTFRVRWCLLNIIFRVFEGGLCKKSNITVLPVIIILLLFEYVLWYYFLCMCV